MRSLSEGDCLALRQVARDAIRAAAFRTLPKPWPQDGVFAERCGVFVTVRVNNHLRGCIGVVDVDEPLGDALVRCAICAASQDPRFPAIREEELELLQVEISLLSSTVPIVLAEIEIGRHGLLVVQGRQRGVLLPQVAMDHHLTVEQFLAETCRKAGLAVDAWRGPETQIFGFTCEVVSDSTQPAPSKLS